MRMARSSASCRSILPRSSVVIGPPSVNPQDNGAPSGAPVPTGCIPLAPERMSLSFGLPGDYLGADLQGSERMAPRVLVADDLSAEAVERLRSRGLDPEVRVGLKPDELVAAIAP